MSKHDLQARPVYHHTRDSIEAHLTIVFAALAVSPGSSTKPAGASRNSSAPRAAIAPSRSAPAARHGPPPNPYPTTSHKHSPRSIHPPVRTSLTIAGTGRRWLESIAQGAALFGMHTLRCLSHQFERAAT